MRFLILALGITTASCGGGSDSPSATPIADTGLVAPVCGQFTPLADSGSPFTRVHFFPKNCNRIMVAGRIETIPAGVGVISGGVIGDLLNACVRGVCGQRLAPFTVYRVYVLMLDGVMTMNFDQIPHREDPTYGHQVHLHDQGQTLVGMIRTNADGLVIGSANEQATISWHNRGTTGLALPFSATTCSAALVPIPHARVGFLTFGINGSFTQAFTVPNVYVTGSVNGPAWISIAIDGLQNSSIYSSHDGAVHVAAIGAGGASEGWIEGTLMMSTGGAGCVTLTGSIYTSPLES